MEKNNTSMSIRVKKREIEEYKHCGKTYVEGREGSEFSIVFRNNNSFRVAVVLSVDGLSVIDGKPAGNNSNSYLVESHSELVVPGWKLDNDHVASFKFSGKEGSYAVQSKTDITAANVGVIGAMVYAEKYKMPEPSHFYSKSTTFHSYNPNSSMNMRGVPISCSYTSGCDNGSVSQMSYASANASQMNNIGTAFGDMKDFETEKVEFERGDLVSILAMYYDNRRGLKARGIKIEKPKYQRPAEPNPFPASDVGCIPPEGWVV